jgi:hypothetical protein
MEPQERGRLPGDRGDHSLSPIEVSDILDVKVAMVPDDVPCIHDPFDRFGEPLRPLTNDEERRPHVLEGQDFEHLVGAGRVGAIVKRERNCGPVTAGVTIIPDSHRRLL